MSDCERRYIATVTVLVEITVRDPDIIERVTGPEGDAWREQMYQLHTQDDVLKHLARNAIAIPVWHASQLDGWADLAPSASDMVVSDITVEIVEEMEAETEL